jgi:hypothetical protein
MRVYLHNMIVTVLRPFFRRMMRHSDTPITYQHGATMKQNQRSQGNASQSYIFILLLSQNKTNASRSSVPFSSPTTKCSESLRESVEGSGEFKARLSVRENTHAKTLLVHLLRYVRWHIPKRGSATNHESKNSTSQDIFAMRPRLSRCAGPRANVKV